MWFGISSACGLWSSGYDVVAKPMQNMTKIMSRRGFSGLGKLRQKSLGGQYNYRCVVV